jgi:hypothetical protein
MLMGQRSDSQRLWMVRSSLRLHTVTIASKKNQGLVLVDESRDMLTSR